MADYFKPWRRKVGVVTLLMALVVTGAWVDSFNGDLNFDFQMAYGRSPGSYETRSIGIYQHCVELRKTRSTPRRVSNIQNLDPATLERYEKVIVIYEDSDQSSDPTLPAMASLEMPELRQDVISVDGSSTIQKRSETFYFERLLNEEKEFSIPLSSISIPLTLLSSFLLFSKPRKSTSKKSAELIPVEGK